MTVKCETLIAISRVLDDNGIAFEIGHGGKHAFVMFVVGGRHHKVAYPERTRSWHAPKKAACQIKRLLKETV